MIGTILRESSFARKISQTGANPGKYPPGETYCLKSVKCSKSYLVESDESKIKHNFRRNPLIVMDGKYFSKF